MKYVLAIDSFKGCLTSEEAENAAEMGIKAVDKEADIVKVPVSDGGEGMLDVFTALLPMEKRRVSSYDAMMRPVEGVYGVSGDTAYIEIAKTCGLAQIEPEVRNPLVATSYGVGLLVADALQSKCRRMIIGLGGSATSDNGIGMLQAVKDVLAPGSLLPVDQILAPYDSVEVILASDVVNPLCGERGAAKVFAVQKGASLKMINILERKAITFARMSALHCGYDCKDVPGAGAAGGLGYAFLQYFKAKVQSGIDLLLNMTHFDDIIVDADYVITGEGASDRQTLMGKVPVGILKRVQSYAVPVILIAGKIADVDRDILKNAGFANVVCINPETMTLEEAMEKDTAKSNIFHTMKRLFTRDTTMNINY